MNESFGRPAAQPEPAPLEAGNLLLELEGRVVTLDGQAILLTHQEFELLRELLAHRDKVLAQKALSVAIWGSNGQAEHKRLSVVICRLRKKLAASQPYAIEMVRGRGYGLVRPDLTPR